MSPGIRGRIRGGKKAPRAPRASGSAFVGTGCVSGSTSMSKNRGAQGKFRPRTEFITATHVAETMAPERGRPRPHFSTNATFDWRAAQMPMRAGRPRSGAIAMTTESHRAGLCVRSMEVWETGESLHPIDQIGNANLSATFTHPLFAERSPFGRKTAGWNKVTWIRMQGQLLHFRTPDSFRANLQRRDLPVVAGLQRKCSNCPGISEFNSSQYRRETARIMLH